MAHKEGMREVATEQAKLEQFYNLYTPRLPINRSGLAGFDCYGNSIPLNGLIGGDLVEVYKFDSDPGFAIDERIAAAEALHESEKTEALNIHKRRFAALITDVEGHDQTDGLLALLVHNISRQGIEGQLDRYGEVHAEMFERLNNFFLREGGKKVSLTYAEFTDRGSEGTCRFILAGNAMPYLYRAASASRDTEASKRWKSGGWIGLFPSEAHKDKTRYVQKGLSFKEPYAINEFSMGKGDVALLFTDGYHDVGMRKDKRYPLERVSELLKGMSDASAKDIGELLLDERATGHPVDDDVTLLVVKKT